VADPTARRDWGAAILLALGEAAPFGIR
jgi:hypothetical protein